MRHFTWKTTDESGLLTIEYEVEMTYDIQPREPENGIMVPHLFDLQVTRIRFKADGMPAIWFGGGDAARRLNERIATDKNLRDEIESAIAEHESEQQEAAKEAAADAKWQARRDGE
jgi:hypothetical protein